MDLVTPSSGQSTSSGSSTFLPQASPPRSPPPSPHPNFLHPQLLGPPFLSGRPQRMDFPHFMVKTSPVGFSEPPSIFSFIPPLMSSVCQLLRSIWRVVPCNGSSGLQTTLNSVLGQNLLGPLNFVLVPLKLMIRKALLAKLVQKTTMEAYEPEFEVLQNRTTRLSSSFLTSCFVVGLLSELRAKVLATMPASLSQDISMPRLHESKIAFRTAQPKTYSARYQPQPYLTHPSKPSP